MCCISRGFLQVYLHATASPDFKQAKAFIAAGEGPALQNPKQQQPLINAQQSYCTQLQFQQAHGLQVLLASDPHAISTPASAHCKSQSHIYPALLSLTGAQLHHMLGPFAVIFVLHCCTLLPYAAASKVLPHRSAHAVHLVLNRIVLPNQAKLQVKLRYKR